MAKKPWFPSGLGNQAAMFSNIKGKIGGYTSVLPITAAQTTQIVLICNTFLTAYEYVEQIRASTSSLIEWRDLIFTGQPTGDPAPATPAYPSVSMPAGAFIGIITEFRELRELIVASPGYTEAIGEDLMIVGEEQGHAPEGSVAPSLNVTTATGYIVNVAGSMQGYDAMRIEYQRAGSTAWNIAAFATKMPANFTISPATPGQPENGRIRAIFIQKNADFGSYSPEYPVTIS
jgi:hypothetical protein